MSAADRPVLIVGARSDIARAIAHGLAARGHPIQLAARGGAEGLAREVSDIKLRHGVPVTAHDCDVTDLAGLAGFVDGLPETPWIAVIAVGLLGDQGADAGDPAALQRIATANYLGPAQLAELLADRMAGAGGARALLGIGSVAGERGRAKNYVYGSAKAGFHTYLSGLRQKHAASDLLVMTVKPGFVRTTMTQGMDLPAPLTDDPDAFARGVLSALDRRRPVHMPPRWRLVMGVIRAIPEPLFTRLRF